MGNGDENTSPDSNTFEPAAGTCLKVTEDNMVHYALSSTKSQHIPSLMGPGTITFEKDYHTLTVTGGSGTGDYLTEDPAIAIAADPAPAGQKFDHWKVTSGSVTFADAASTTLTMTSDAIVKAVYAFDFDALTVGITPTAITAEKGKTYTYARSIKNAAGEAADITGVTVTPNWELTGGTAGTTIDANGKLTIAADETASALTITATATLSLDGKSKTYPTATAYVYLGEQTVGNLVIVGGVPGTDYTVEDKTSASGYQIINFAGSGNYFIKMIRRSYKHHNGVYCRFERLPKHHHYRRRHYR